ncbi:MAG TPA: TorF family putative porin [Rhodocyclaceae bacterium]|nr:TorF family putative porin [Rhodocyclaceae bacterium]
MKKTALATTLVSLFSLSSIAMAADAPASPHTFTANVGGVSDYLFRGVSQTHGKAALQGGVDYSHQSGIYLGAWGSTITWVKDWVGKGSTEIDLYGGYKSSFAGGDWNYDIGVISYNYPGKGSAIPTYLANPNTTEIYGAIGYKWLTVKYSHAISKNFIGWYGGTGLNEDTRGSGYLELNAAYDLGDGWGLTGHIGHQKVKRSVTIPGVPTYEDANYSDWKIGITKDVGFGTVGLAYSDTDAKGNCSNPLPTSGNVSVYCWGTNSVPVTGPSANFRDVAKGQLVLSFLKTF